MRGKEKNINPLLFGKVQPNSIKIESAVLGIMMMFPKSIKLVKEILDINDFYSDVHQKISSVIYELEKTTTVDLILVGEYLIKQGEIDEVGGFSYLAKLTDSVVSDTHLKKYCLVIKQKSTQRKLIDFSSIILNKANSNTEDVFDVLIEAENGLKGISSELYGLKTTSLSGIAVNIIKEFDDSIYNAQNNIVDGNAVYTGFKEWDVINGKLFSGVYIVAGRPGMGKGVHMTELACRMGTVYDVGIINGEMTDEQLFKRIGCNLMGIDNFLFKKNPLYITKEEQEQLYNAMNAAINLKLHIENSRFIHKIANKIKLWVENHNVKCVLADFLTLFKVPPELEKYYTKTQQVDYILDVFTQLCKDLKVPIILYVQMNREILGRNGNKEPNLADLKQSGSIEELAYQVSFLHRPEYYDATAVTDEFGESTKGLMYQIVSKHRDGQLGRLKLKAKLECSKINDWGNDSLLNFGSKVSDLPF